MYRYLEKEEHKDAWINGGLIPLSLASSYLSQERSGIFTPDELLQQSLKNAPAQIIEHVFGTSVNNARLEIHGASIIVDGIKFNNVRLTRQLEDSLVICLSTKLDKKIAERLGKKACVEIINVERLNKEISKQLGVNGMPGTCHYTIFDDRNHFLKSVLDCWQEEYRVVWTGIEKSVWVKLPKGIAKDVTNSIL